MSRFKRKPKPPPWPDFHYGRPTQCQVKMRTPGAISMWNGCDLDAGHDGVHRWAMDMAPNSRFPNGEHYEGTFTTEAAYTSWGRRASIEEMNAAAANALPGTSWSAE